MNRVYVASLLTLGFALLTLFLSDFIWPPEKAAIQPTGPEAIFFQMVAVTESILFGLGIAFFYLMLPAFKKGLEMKHWPTVLSIPAITWMFLNWWPHDNMHLYFGEAMNSLILIEMFFHGSMILAVVVVAYSYYLAMSGKRN